MMDPRLQAILEEFRQKYPDVPITSGYRDPARNAAVGGARGSQHMSGKAFDFSVRGIEEERQQEIANWLREKGARGFGYYPNSQSMHADIGEARAWGPNYSRTSLGQTPQWFQRFAGVEQPTSNNATPLAGATDPRRGLLSYAGNRTDQPPIASASAPPERSRDVAQVGGSTEKAADPVYRSDIGTSLRRMGNFLAPDIIDPAKPMTTDEIAAEKKDEETLGQLATANKAFASLQASNAPKEAQIEMLKEQLMRPQFKPIPRIRGLLG